jgi:hypothetical protein
MVQSELTHKTKGYTAGAEGAVGVTSFIPRAEQSGFGRAHISAPAFHTTLGYFSYPSAAHPFLSILYPERTVVTGTSFSLLFSLLKP